ncbi:hypothetical protein NDU88_005472 [Pleurodeles waltl]|uniref:Uncharacterized protein n=1 Tax=Pleurodeles waltl TaxID=8319 RepID=A0AAV7PFU0_PLEWA|nr:hypothetical protein NDU88_005472 [Pleurodeles waltl]
MGKPRPKSQGSNLSVLCMDQPQADREMGDGPGPSKKQETLNKILQAIEGTKLTLSQEIGKVSAELSHLCTDHHKLSDRVKDTEAVLEDLQSAHRAIKSHITQLTMQVQKHEHRAEDAEGCGRCNNVHIVGLPEGREGLDEVTYLETWLKTLTEDQPLTPFFTLERVHWVPAQPLAPGKLPRPIVAKLLHYRDRDILLQRAREAGPFEVGGGRVTLFPNYRAAVQRRCATFTAVKCSLRDEGIIYSLVLCSMLTIM